MMVAFMRAVADAGGTHVREFHDPTARLLLDDAWTKRFVPIRRQLYAGVASVRVSLARVSADTLALRTVVTDAAVRSAVEQGTTQFVILGAGLDGRAWRMPELAGRRVFEVDHPDTQSYKLQCLGRLPPSVANLEFVGVDFERESLDDALSRAGHDPSVHTCWIWEGVVMYLSKDVVQSTLRVVAARSCPGSTLIVNYHTAKRRGLMALWLRVLGEPDLSVWSPEDMARGLRDAGFRVDDDTGIAEWARRFAEGDINLRAGAVMRVAVAHRH